MKISPAYTALAADDDDRDPVRFVPPDGQREWAPVTAWTDRDWTHWLSQHPGWTPDRITQYLTVDRYRYGVGFKRRPTEDYTYFYLPLPAAVPLHASKVPNLCYGGAVGGSKSHSTRWDAYRHLLAIPDYASILMRRTFGELESNHLQKLSREAALINDFFQREVMDLAISNHEMRFPLTRGLFKFGHCQNVGDEEKYLGTEYDEFRPDEMATFDKTQITGVQGRLRSTKHGDFGRIIARLIGTTNPGGGHTRWIKDWFIDKAVPRSENPKYDPADYAFLPASLYDNPHLMDPDGSYTAYEKRLFMYSPSRRKQLLEGDWTSIEGQFFPEWSKDRHVAAIEIPPGCKIERWIDWGYDPNPGVCHWVACFPNGQLYVFAEWVFNGQGRTKLVAGEVAKRIARITKDDILPAVKSKGISKTIGDPSMWAKSGHTGESYQETFSRNGVRMIPADNDRVQGWGRLRHWLQPHPEGGAWLMYHPDCTYAIRTLPDLVVDPNNPDDCDSTGEDHAADADRYGVMGRPTPTTYRWKPLPTMPDSIATLVKGLSAPVVRPFGKVR